jgi:hypothetical protein
MATETTVARPTDTELAARAALATGTPVPRLQRALRRLPAVNRALNDAYLRGYLTGAHDTRTRNHAAADSIIRLLGTRAGA